MLHVSERRLRLDMDITVTRAADGRRAWTLTDLLGRPLGRIAQARGPGFIIEPHERAYVLMAKVPSGPFASFEDALRAIEKHLHGACHLTPDQR
jgi:hypothetical protein